MPAPPRFLPEYDNVLLSHADRTRFRSAEPRGRLGAGGVAVHGALLVDGAGRATWRIERAGRGAATLFVDHVGAFARAEAAAVAGEGERMLRFLEPQRSALEVRLLRIDG